MEERYCVFWFPSIYHTSINERLQRFEIESPITDFGQDVVKLKVSIDYCYSEKTLKADLERAHEDEFLIKKSLHFEVYKTNIKNQQENVFNSFDLTYKDHSNNGMVVYSFQEPDNYPKNNKEIPSFDKALTTIFYHCAKSLFHNHEVQTDRDSGLTAYLPGPSFKPSSIREKDNEAILFFLSQYETIFMNYAETASDLIRRRDAIVAKFEGKISLSDDKIGTSGYKALTQFGRRHFRKWYDDPLCQTEVSCCKKDILLSWLQIKPHYKKRKRRREYYLNRLIKVGEATKTQLANNPQDKTIKEHRIVDKQKELVKIFREWGTLPWKTQTRKEIYPVDAILRRCEIELGMIDIKRGNFYRKLIQSHLDLPILTERARKEIGMLCEGALTEYVYCKTLLESKYNTHVTHNKFDENGKSEQEVSELDRWRKKACNIRNAIRYIETVKYRCSNAQLNSVNLTLKKADKLSQNAKIWTVVGIILSVIGVALTTVGTILAIKADAAKQECGCSEPLNQEGVSQVLFR